MVIVNNGTAAWRSNVEEYRRPHDQKICAGHATACSVRARRYFLFVPAGNHLLRRAHANAFAQGLETKSQPNTFADRLTYSRAVEAAIWARPLTGFKAMMDGLRRDGGVGYNDIGYFSTVQNGKFKWSTTNATTPYVLSYWNVEKEPVVVQIPAEVPDIRLFGALLDAWQRPLADVGPDGVDGGRGAKYLLIASDYRGPVPDGFIPVTQTTANGWLSLRMILKDNSPASLQKAVAYVKQIKVSPLSQVNDPKMHYIDLFDKKVNLVSRLDADMYRTLYAIIQTERIEERDLVMTGMLQSLGIEKGKPFAPSAEMVAMLDAAAKETQEHMRQQYLFGAANYYPGTQWRMAFPPGVYETRYTGIYPGSIDLDRRGEMYNYSWGSAERVGKATYYINLPADAKGQPLDGSRNYRLKVPANAPVTQFSEAELASQYGDRFDRLREASSKLSERLKELPLKESLNLYADKNAAENKELKAAGNAADEYNSVPRLDIDFLPLQIAGGCAATIEASLAAYIEPTTLKHTHAEVDNDTIEIWSVTYGIVGAQPTFSNQAISYAEQAIKKLVNDWTASQN
jgi:hypothetical protein